MGSHGQQVHFLIFYKGKIAGIISGGSAVFTVSSRNAFFGIVPGKKGEGLHGIVDNTVFRLKRRKPGLASQVMELWREAVAAVWLDLYGIEVYGYETFVIESGGTAVLPSITNPRQNGERIETTEEAVNQNRVRDGALYLHDGWSLAGKSDGSAKSHKGGRGLAGSLKGKSFIREKVQPKLVLCRWRDGYSVPLRIDNYQSSWRAVTPEEKQRAKYLSNKRRQLTRMCYYWNQEEYTPC